MFSRGFCPCRASVNDFESGKVLNLVPIREEIVPASAFVIRFPLQVMI